MIFESEKFVNTVDKIYNALDLFPDLVFRHKDMGVVLSKASYSHKAMESSGFLVSVNKPEFADS